MGDLVPFRRPPADFFEELLLEMTDNPLEGVDVFIVRQGEQVVYTSLEPDAADEVLVTLRRLHPLLSYEMLTLHLQASELLTRGRQ